jgi:hypothetical protein
MTLPLAIEVPPDRECVVDGLVVFRDRPREWWTRLRELRLEARRYNEKRRREGVGKPRVKKAKSPVGLLEMLTAEQRRMLGLRG